MANSQFKSPWSLSKWSRHRVNRLTLLLYTPAPLQSTEYPSGPRTQIATEHLGSKGYSSSQIIEAIYLNKNPSTTDLSAGT